MRIESKLCHVYENKVIVQVNGWLNDQSLGSSLAEGETVEIAEDKAILRLHERINHDINDLANINSINEDQIKASIHVELPKSENIDDINIKDVPSDWSNVLIEIDSEIQRLMWTRDDEIKFLEKNLGYNSRNKITNYNDIVKYLSLLKKTNKQDLSNLDKDNIQLLIEESDIILRELSWDNRQGREFLHKEFNVTTRKELNEKQLILFVQKLKLIRNQFQNL
tara:strand:+ start:119 stop:787 length:669 start_codon:yes stop_codon:yes gene_type:complete